MQTINDILKKFNPTQDRYISREFQSYAIHLCEVLQDEAHKSLYMKLAKTVPRAILEKALSFVVDAKVDNKAKLFMWKMKELRQQHGLHKKQTKTNVISKKSKKELVSEMKEKELPLFP